MASVGNFTVPNNLDPRLREKAFDAFLCELKSTASGSQKQESDTVPPPADPGQAQRMRPVAQRPVIQQKPEVPSRHEPPSSRLNAKLGLSLSRRMGDDKQTAQDAGSEYSSEVAPPGFLRKSQSYATGQAPKTKGGAVNEKYMAVDERGGKPSQLRALGNGSVRREVTRRSAITRTGAEKAQAEMIERLRNMIVEHEHTLRQLPSLREFEEMKKRISSLEGRVFLRDMENDRLQTEKESLKDSLTEAKDSNMKLQVELDSFKRHFGVIPPKYRRRDDLHGKPFKDWRRDPTTAAHRPKPIDTDCAARSVHRIATALPAVAEGDSFACDSSDSTLSTEDDDAVERSTWKPQREEHIVPSVQRTEVCTNGSTSITVPSTTSVKRAHDGHSSDTDLRSPPMKRFRERKKIEIADLCNHSAEDVTNLHTPVRPCATMRDESYLQDCIEQGFL